MARTVTHYFSVFLLLSFTFFSSAQEKEILPVGATLYYNYYQGSIKFVPAYGYSTLTVESDTTLKRKSCKKLVARHYKKDGSLVDKNQFLVQTDTHTVKFYKNGTFYPLYDFNTKPGDVHSVKVLDPKIDTTFITRIDSIHDFPTSSGQSMKVFYTSTLPVKGWTQSSVILNQWGGLRYFFPYRKIEKRKAPMGLRCYSEEKQLPDTLAKKCKATFQIKDISTQRAGDSLHINPPTPLHQIQFYSKGKISTIAKPVSISVFNARGQIFITKKYQFGEKHLSINIADLEDGKYYLKVQLPQKSFTQTLKIGD